jgi:hypothetical protein
MLSRFTSNQGKVHWDANPRVIRYLKETMNYGLHYQREPVVLDTMMQVVESNSKFTIGWIFTLGGAAISWGSKKQTLYNPFYYEI